MSGRRQAPLRATSPHSAAAPATVPAAKGQGAAHACACPRVGQRGEGERRSVDVLTQQRSGGGGGGECAQTFEAFQTLGSTQVDLIEYQFLKHGVNMLVLKDVAAFVRSDAGEDARSTRSGGWLW